MKAAFQIISIVILLIIFSCKKEKPIASAPLSITPKYLALTKNNWRRVGMWYDTTVTAKLNPSIVPADSSINVLSFMDSCDYYTCIQFNPDGYYYSLKGKYCPYPWSNTYIGKIKEGSWSLLNNDTQLKYYGTADIILLNDTILKFYEYEIYNFTKKLVAVYQLKPYVYK